MSRHARRRRYRARATERRRSAAWWSLALSFAGQVTGSYTAHMERVREFEREIALSMLFGGIASRAQLVDD